MDIPLKIRVPLCIEQGCVFNFFLDFNDSKRESKNRYFVILNSNPKTDSVLIMVTSTRQIEKRYEFIKRAGISENTLVKVTPKEYSVFSQESIFNCNDVIEIGINDLIKKLEDSGSMNYPKITKDLLVKLIKGVKESPLVTEDIKKLL